MKIDLPKPIDLTVPQAAQPCGVSRNTRFTWVKRGMINAHRTPGRTNMIRPGNLVEFMDKSRLFIPDELVKLAEAEKGGQPTPTLPQGVPTILVVDDDASLRTIFMRALDQCRMLQAETGYEAMHILTMHKAVDLICLDLNMEGMDGMQTLEQVSASRPEIPVIIVSAYTGELPDKLVEEGKVAKILDKPVRSEQLVKAVADVLEAME